jgi:hypothetical protein
MSETLTSMKGRENVYTCQACGGTVVTVDRDTGTTPFMISHSEVAGSNCDGPMYSGWYRPHRAGSPTHEWYAPTKAELKAECAPHDRYTREAIRQHVEMGGLLLRPIAARQPTEGRHVD